MKIALIEQGKYINHKITIEKHKLCKKAGIDVVRLNWKTTGDIKATYDRSNFKKVPRWSEGRDFLTSKVLDKYDYIFYTDEDTYLNSFEANQNPYGLVLDFLKSWNPIAANANSKNVWSWNEEIINRSKKGMPTVIRHHDSCNLILRNDIAKALYPIQHHGSDCSMWYQQYICHKLRKRNYLSIPNVFAVNGIIEPHHHSDDRSLNYKNKILSSFSSKLKNEDDFWNNFVKNRKIIDETLLSEEPLKGCRTITKEEVNTLFKGAL